MISPIRTSFVSKIFARFQPQTKVQGCIDRFEGQYAVIDFGGKRPCINVPKKDLPKGVKEGLWLDLVVKGDKVLKATPNQQKTDEMKAEINKLMKDMFVD